MIIGDLPATAEEEVLGKVQIQLAVSRRMRIDHEWRYDLQSPFWRLYVHKRPGAFVTHEGRLIPLKPGRAFIIPAWVRFQTTANRAVTQDYIHFYVTGLPPTLLRNFFDRPYFLAPDPVAEGLCEHWRSGFESEPGFAALAWASALAYAAVAEAAGSLPRTARRAFFDSWKEFSPIGPALKCIEQRPSPPPANQELARLCHLSTDHFIRRFRLITGMTPAQYGIERRVSLAAQWLTATTRVIEEIAADAGFTDRFHFSRVFKARLGMSPAAYRRLHRSATQGGERSPAN